MYIGFDDEVMQIDKGWHNSWSIDSYINKNALFFEGALNLVPLKQERTYQFPGIEVHAGQFSIIRLCNVNV